MEYYGQTLDKHKAKSKWGGMLLAREIHRRDFRSRICHSGQAGTGVIGGTPRPPDLGDALIVVWECVLISIRPAGSKGGILRPAAPKKQARERRPQRTVLNARARNSFTSSSVEKNLVVQPRTQPGMSEWFIEVTR